MKRFLFGMVFGALISGSAIYAHDTYYDVDDVMQKLDGVESMIMIFCVD